VRLALPKDPKKRKQLLLALAAGGAILAAYVMYQRNAAGGSSVPAGQIAPDPGAVGTGGLLPATSGLPTSDAVTIDSVQAAIAQAKALLKSVGLTVVRKGGQSKGKQSPKHHPKKNPPKKSGAAGAKKKHPARKRAHIGNPVTPPDRQHYPVPIVRVRMKAPRSQVAQSSTRVAPSPYRVASRRHTGPA
jgi:hypothetical protein